MNIIAQSDAMAAVQSSEPDSAPRDLLFAAASVSLLCGIRLPVGDLPLFAVFAAVILAVSLRSLFSSPFVKHLLVPPLLLFLVVHLASAFRISSGNGLPFLLQALVVIAFAASFANRYAQVSMARYLRYTGIGMTALLAYVVIYHLAQGRYTSFKLLSDSKAVFDLLPLMLLVLRRSRAGASKYLLPILVPVFVVILLLSGERKAYILLLLLSPFLLNFRSLTTYLLPLVLAVVISAGLSLDRTGYVERQLDTLVHLAQGETQRQKTISDEARSWAIQHAARLFVENPILGVGTNGYSLTVDLNVHVSSATHNEWLRVAAENGVVGLFFFTATFIWGFVGLLRKQVNGRVRTGTEKLVAFALFGTLLVYLSFEALDFIVLTSFMLAPLVQFLRLDPNGARRAKTAVAHVPAPALNTAVMPGY